MEAIEQIEVFIQKQVKKADASGVVIGISGGIDSAVVATLAVRALGKNNVHLVHVPESCNSIDRDAEDLATQLGIEMPFIYLDPLILQFQKHCPDLFGNRVNLGNLKARIRMIMLYGYANEFNLLVIGTTNYTELVLGYFTKFGDGGVDIEPILHLTKTRVRGIAKHIGVPQPIIDKAPSADLWEGQTDEKEMGFTYAEMDDLIECRDDDLTSPVAVYISEMYQKTEHKRTLPANLLEENGLCLE